MFIDVYLEEIDRVCSVGNLFRGQSRERYDLNSSAYRRLDKGNGCPAALFINYNQGLIEQSKMRGYGIKESNKLSDLQIIGELQHFGAATCLIDFTESITVALWFACQSLDDNGAIFILRKDAMKEITSDNVEDPIKGFLSEDNLYYWKPDNINNRIPAQSSVFVFGKPVLDDGLYQKIPVKKEDKRVLLHEINTAFNINERTLFPDFYGFATSQGQAKPLTNEIDFFNILKHYISFKKWKDVKNILEEKSQSFGDYAKFRILIRLMKGGVDDIKPFKECFSNMGNSYLQLLYIMIFDGNIPNQKNQLISPNELDIPVGAGNYSPPVLPDKNNLAILEKLFYVLLRFHNENSSLDVSTISDRPGGICAYWLPYAPYYRNIGEMISDGYPWCSDDYLGVGDTIKSFIGFIFESGYFSKEVKDAFRAMMIAYNEYNTDAKEIFQFLEDIEKTSEQK